MRSLHSPEYISFLLVSLCHTYDQTVHILQKFVPLKPERQEICNSLKIENGNFLLESNSWCEYRMFLRLEYLKAGRQKWRLGSHLRNEL